MYSNLDYLAGLFDGEGSFSMQVQTRTTVSGSGGVVISARISMTLKYGKFILEDFVESFGGRIYHYSDGMDRWSVSDSKRARIFAEQMLPRLQIKRTIASNFISALDMLDSPRSRETDVALAKMAYSLNPVRKSTKPVDNLLVEINNIYDRREKLTQARILGNALI